MRILLVEDDKYYGQCVSESLEDYGLVVDRADSLHAALMLPAEQYDAFVVDVMLPNDPVASGISAEETRGGFLSGVAFARRIKRRDPAARVIFLTATAPPAEAYDWAETHDTPILYKFDADQALLGALERLGVVPNPPTPKAFVVHGRDETTLTQLKQYITDVLRWQPPVILREEPSCGKTIIEKFEQCASRVDCVFILLTPDDVVVDVGNNDEKRRSRQNVIFELGFFYAQFGRHSGRVLLLYKGALEIPSDLHGIVWIDISNGVGSAHELISREVERFTHARAGE